MNMDSELLLGGKVTFVVGGKNRVFVKHPVDLIRFPEDARLRFIDRRGGIRICHEDLAWLRLI